MNIIKAFNELKCPCCETKLIMFNGDQRCSNKQCWIDTWIDIGRKEINTIMPTGSRDILYGVDINLLKNEIYINCKKISLKEIIDIDSDFFAIMKFAYKLAENKILE